jgi:hypothetical protein
LESKGKPCDYYLRERNTVNKAYKYYHPEREPSEQMARTSILVDAGGDPEEISNVPGMERLRTIAGRSEEERFWFVPEELRDEVNMLLR